MATEQQATNHHPNNQHCWIIGMMLDKILLPITFAYKFAHEFVQSFVFFNMLMPFGSAISHGSTFQEFTTSCTNKYFTCFTLSSTCFTEHLLDLTSNILCFLQSTTSWLSKPASNSPLSPLLYQLNNFSLFRLVQEHCLPSSFLNENIHILLL